MQVGVFYAKQTESAGVANIETDDQRYNQTGSEFGVRNIKGRVMLPDSTVFQWG